MNLTWIFVKLSLFFLQHFSIFEILNICIVKKEKIVKTYYIFNEKIGHVAIV
jgi:hypothetical protein